MQPVRGVFAGCSDLPVNGSNHFTRLRAETLWVVLDAGIRLGDYWNWGLLGSEEAEALQVAIERPRDAEENYQGQVFVQLSRYREGPCSV